MLICVGCGSAVVLNADADASNIYINEVMSSNSHTLVSEELSSPDWIELYNASDKTLDLLDYGLSDNIKEPHKWTLPDVKLAPGEYLVVYACKRDNELCTNFGLSKSGEILYLSDPYFNMLQTLTIPALETDISYARRADGSFGYCAAPTPGTKNGDDIVDSMGDVQYAGSDSLHIAEVLPDNQSVVACEDGSYAPYVKLYNSSASPVSLASFCLSDDRNDPMKWQMPDVTVAPGAYAMIFLSGRDNDSGELHASFKLGSEDNGLYLSDIQAQICDSFIWDLSVPEDIAVVASDTYSAFPRPNEANDARTFTEPHLHDADASETILLNEVLLRNAYSLTDEDGNRDAWAELYNNSDQMVSLEGYCLSDNPDKPLKWAFPKDAQIEAHGYLLVYLDGKNRTGEYLHTPFSLSVSDGSFLLTNKNGLAVQRIDIDPSIGSNISFGRTESGEWNYFATPTPGAKNSAHSFATMGEVSITNLQGIYISEVCAVNAAKSGRSDWIELHNGADYDVDLSGWHLTDDPDNLERFTFPDIKIPAGDYQVIYATTGSEKQEGVTAPFGISASGETLILTNKENEIKDIFETGFLRSGISSGRGSNDAARVFFTESTKGAANSSATAPSYVQQPVLSELSLYHKETFSLSISCPTSGATIYYSTDGSKPNTESSVYTQPLQISSNTIVKVKAFKEGLLDSEMSVGTYVFDDPHTLPVVCLSTDSESFDQVYSVIDRWEKVEREGYCEYYEADGKIGTEFPCGLRVNGASTLLARQKSLSIFLRGGYGVSESNYPFFSDSSVKVYHSLSVRNSGQDRDKARMRDSLFAKAVKGLNIETIETRPVIVYINAQYWGIYDLNENQNEDYMATYYGVDPDAVDIIRRNETRLAGEKADMKRIRDFANNHDLSDDAKYQEFCQWVDVDYFTDYLIAQTYFANGDMFNQKYWRSQDYSVKWRPLFFDLDLAFSSSNPSRNILPSYFKPEGVPSQDGSITNMDIFCGLHENAAWREQFCARYVYVVYNFFAPERINAILDAYAAELEPEMERHIKKWGDPSSVSAWKKNVQSLRDCLSERQSYALKALKSEFNLTDAQMQAHTDAAKAAQVQQ